MTCSAAHLATEEGPLVALAGLLSKLPTHSMLRLQECHSGSTHHAPIHVQHTVPDVHKQPRVPGVAQVPLQMPQQWLQCS